MRLGDKFPSELREGLADEHLRIGAVLRFFTTETTPPKIKIVIIVGFDGNRVLLAYVFVNTEINPHFFPTEELRNLQLTLRAEGKDYLDYDSYIDCSEIHEQEVSIIRQMMVGDAEVHRGDLLIEEYSEILEKIKISRKISTATKQKFGFTDSP